MHRSTKPDDGQSGRLKGSVLYAGNGDIGDHDGPYPSEKDQGLCSGAGGRPVISGGGSFTSRRSMGRMRSKNTDQGGDFFVSLYCQQKYRYSDLLAFCFNYFWGGNARGTQISLSHARHNTVQSAGSESEQSNLIQAPVESTFFPSVAQQRLPFETFYRANDLLRCMNVLEKVNLNTSFIATVLFWLS